MRVTTRLIAVVQRLFRRFGVLDRIAVGLLVLGLVAVATGLLPGAAAGAVLERVLPLLVFLATVIVLAELTAWSGVFDVIATGVARLGRGRYPLLFVLCVLFAATTTVTLNLDTTAVLLTPVVLALAARVGIAALPLAMTTVWLANTASLLLPVSNLTNLLALRRIDLAPVEFAGRMWAAQLGALAATMVCLWVFYWRRGRRGADRYELPRLRRPVDLPVFVVAAVACVGFVVALLLDVELWVASSAAAAVLCGAFASRWRTRATERGFVRSVTAIVPWRLLVFVSGLFLVVETISRLGLAGLMAALMGEDNGPAGMFRAAATGAGLSNAVNNLPAYLAGEAVVPTANHDQLLALLVGTNVGPVITPWASLATLLWLQRCHAFGVDVSMRRFVVTGAVLAVTAVGVAVALLVVTR